MNRVNGPGRSVRVSSTRAFTMTVARVLGSPNPFATDAPRRETVTSESGPGLGGQWSGMDLRAKLAREYAELAAARAEWQREEGERLARERQRAASLPPPPPTCRRRHRLDEAANVYRRSDRVECRRCQAEAKRA